MGSERPSPAWKDPGGSEGWDGCALHPRSLCLGKGQEPKLPIQGNFGSEFKRFLALAGKSFERGFCSWSFSCLIKSGIHSNSIAGDAWGKFTASTTGSDPALRGNEISHQTYPEKPKFGFLNSHQGKFFKRARVFKWDVLPHFPSAFYHGLTQAKIPQFREKNKICISFNIIFF